VSEGANVEYHSPCRGKPDHLIFARNRLGAAGRQALSSAAIISV